MYMQHDVTGNMVCIETWMLCFLSAPNAEASDMSFFITKHGLHRLFMQWKSERGCPSFTD